MGPAVDAAMLAHLGRSNGGVTPAFPMPPAAVPTPAAPPRAPTPPRLGQPSLLTGPGTPRAAMAQQAGQRAGARMPAYGAAQGNLGYLSGAMQRPAQPRPPSRNAPRPQRPTVMGRYGG